ncbi:Uncharacterised protein [Mycolicibacterium chitae]|uniref:Uncharacterized protein n=1 Tax=Mycolicibacterium chitae TaxID=1792 RepID=A0A3S4S864_MYCCI|nr:Uncharacterised protein [Mycolicibacterium chitae]
MRWVAVCATERTEIAPRAGALAVTLPSVTVPHTTAGRRGLTQRPAALALAAGLLAVPGIPMLANAALPEPPWQDAQAEDQLDIATEDGHRLAVVAPDGWVARDLGDGAVLQGEDATVLIQVFDLDGRDPDAVAQRLIRLNRVQGISSALDGGRVESTDGTLTGTTCLAVTAAAAGSCAFLADEDMIVSVVALGPSAPPIADVVGPMTRTAP